MSQNVVIFEARGGLDKGPDGHHKDTMSIVNAINPREGWSIEVIYFEDGSREEIYNYLKDNAADAFSKTLFSGAKYTYDDPSKCQDLVDMFLDSIPTITSNLGDYDVPLIWTADFMLDWDDNNNDTYALDEINYSCACFTSHLDMGIQDKVADEVVRVVESKGIAIV